MNAQVENETVEVEVPEVQIPGGQKKFKLVVNVPVETEVDGEVYVATAEVEFGPFDTEERVEGEQKKFLDRGYASTVATIFTCSSVRLALTSLPRIETMDVDVEPEGRGGDDGESKAEEPRSNEDAVAAILEGFDADEAAKTETVQDERGELTDEARDAAYAENEARDAATAQPEVAEPAKDETKAEEAPKPAPRPRRSRKSAATA
jgi:hypothetical protein